MKWILRLYPTSWRERYGNELSDLLDETGWSWLTGLDLLRGSVDAWLHRELPAAAPAPASATLAMTRSGSEQLRPAQQQLRRLARSPGNRTSRRQFLRNTVLGSAGIILLELTGGLLYFFWPQKTGAFGSKIAILRGNIPAPGSAPLKVQDGRFLLINNDDGLLALYWKCPHLGCTIPWKEAEGRFICPCHGSNYDRHGVLIKGPAPRPMDLMPIEVDLNGNLIVDTGDIQERNSFDPSQATQI